MTILENTKSPVGVRILFYDGHCPLCLYSVKWARWAQVDGLCFAPLQGETAKNYSLGREVDECELDSVIYYRDGETLTCSRAILRVLQDSQKISARLIGLGVRVVPRSLRDFAYRKVAQLRYRVFGRYDSCLIPQGSEFLP